ncbi:CIC11C00000003445 [Sungouiella intermedia]|uniref:CIC11C00000003445 n=1 Tax=Sungouiella intermedia TaxID=45354 RepID=A0A1L0DLS4_9ASCO|nr:CIC11C00000003445 [[Candida] intermedia]
MYFFIYLLVFANAFVRFDLSRSFTNNAQLGKRNIVSAKFSNSDFRGVTLAELTVGSNKQKVSVMLLTDLGVLWMPSASCNSTMKNSTTDYDDNDDYDYYDDDGDAYSCGSGFTFDPETLKTFKDANEIFEMEVDDDFIEEFGYRGVDTVGFGNYSTTMKFGIVEYSTSPGWLGIGFAAGPTEKNFTSFGDRLVEEKVISRNVYSVSLGANNASQGTLLFGAIDQSKYEGTLQKVKMVNGSDYRNTIGILYDGVGFSDAYVPVQLYLGYPYLRLPEYTVYSIAKAMNAINDFNGYRVPCYQLNLSESFRFYFSGIEIQVPYRDLVEQVDNACYLTVKERSEGYYLGNNILRSMYFVVDMELQEVALAQASSREQNEQIEEIVSSIPRAKEAFLFNYTKPDETLSSDEYYGFTKVHITDSSRPTYSRNTDPGTIDNGGTEYVQTVDETGWVISYTTSISTTYYVMTYKLSKYTLTETGEYRISGSTFSGVYTTTSVDYYSSSSYLRTTVVGDVVTLTLDHPLSKPTSTSSSRGGASKFYLSGGVLLLALVSLL